jgi:LysR family transcriptional regulator, regulator for bpeEF and oprC
VQGIGIAHVSDVLAIDALRSGALKPLLLEFPAPGPTVNVVYPGARYLTAKVRAFSDFVASIYPRAGVWAEILEMNRQQGEAKRSA